MMARSERLGLDCEVCGTADALELVAELRVVRCRECGDRAAAAVDADKRDCNVLFIWGCGDDQP
ncbi:hypothetical protein ACIBHY_28745 [Nonomuraea sp. NPDC050547]|uniref:hypothetical protein n=1 Tax=Nonomuraea sp. NPDC050547 TaxID=3364368 RepID=UPI003790A110